MTGKIHSLEIYDLDDDSVPNPIKIIGQFIVRGPESSQYYILKPDQPMHLDGRLIECLAIRPHYDRDPIINVVESACTVGIALPNDGATYVEGEVYGFNDFLLWKVGKINPSHS